MVEDAKMTDASAEAAKDSKPKEEETLPPPPPPLEAAGLRLERLLGGSKAAEESTAAITSYYTNPAKVVRRWLTTSSGAAGSATLADIGATAVKLLSPCPPVLSDLNDASAAGDMDTGGEATPDPTFLTVAAHPYESWLISLAVRCLYKAGDYDKACALAQQGIETMNAQFEDSRIVSSVVGALYPLLARLIRWRSLIVEHLPPSATVALRPKLAHAYNMASLRRDADCQATLLNCMLRDLLHSWQSKSLPCTLSLSVGHARLCASPIFLACLSVEQAQKLLANSTFPETASNNQLCRYLYYSGRIQALRLEYTSAFSNLSQSLRKAPTNTATGFRITVQRLLIVVQLLMGEVPVRHVFFTEGMQKELYPYLCITQAVRQGDLAVFSKVVAENAERYKMDQTYTLISRLAHQVVKAGLRNLHLSYSRLSLQDVADRLGLPSAQSAELVVAKAVRDGVLDATIHHEEAYVQSHELVDVYATQEPSEALHRRIAYCLTTHNDAVKGMRYPPDAYKKQLEASRGLRRRGRDDDDDKDAEDDLDDDDLDDY